MEDFQSQVGSWFRPQTLVFAIHAGERDIVDDTQLGDQRVERHVVAGGHDGHRHALLRQLAEGVYYMGEERDMVECKEGEYFTVDSCSLVHPIGRCGRGAEEALGEGKPDGGSHRLWVGLGQPHVLQRALYGADDALSGVGKCAVKVKENVSIFSYHENVTTKQVE